MKSRSLSLLAAGTLAVSTLIATPSIAHADIAVDRQDAASVRAATQEVSRMTALPANWTGSTRTCAPGTTSSAHRAATLSTINLMRSFVGQEPVVEDPQWSAKAAQAALMMAAADRLSHYPDSTWPCYTPDGAEAAARSNLAYFNDGMGGGRTGASSILQYMDDQGAQNRAVGHRMWLLDPRATQMGWADTTTTNATWVVGEFTGSSPRTGDRWVTWPSEGFFPHQLLPTSRRWSFSSRETIDELSAATISVRGPDGPIAVTEVFRTSELLVWEMPTLPVPTGSGSAVYTVTISGIRRIVGEPPVSHSYQVKVIDGMWVDVYTTPGTHHVGGRDWRTTCSKYSSTVERCRAEIRATVVTYANGRFTSTTGWAFNNLSYKPSSRAQWATNPLAIRGEHIIDGRRWRTRCDDEWTGRGACRSEIWATVPVLEDGRWTLGQKFVFNNVVYFSD
ncbi:CAP domain-containing protein [Tessaracoccus flavus]|uniref:SCP domain-containing protein n=1 Tax=Tessaracoccus flavus TaxID=1610493 RepID=A0A1Q2CF96_9ACTN|nr:CAP domain-containing protein [Tessaracoccus flavus]AQP44767.1 hypothetical protein RPIT_08085 [Tessaracoccus flavus]SDZ17090.1 Cysteine-rich secretory protein family protein [Tessaracoccus flavus]